MIKVGVVGATGYAGVELLRILIRHPNVELVAVTSRSDKGRAVSDVFPNLREHTDITFSDPDDVQLLNCDVVFFATPHAVAMHSIPKLLENGVRVIDLSADFRLEDVALWEQWYGVSHSAPSLIGSAVYGLPERNRVAIKDAQLIACPGCYPTAIQLGFLPLLEKGLINAQGLIANAASGVSGAGRQAKVANLFVEVNDSYKAYAASGHRHVPEIRQELNRVANEPVGLTFVPHLLPMNRGILATLYATPKTPVDQKQLQKVFELAYQDEPYVDVMPAGSHPETRSVKGANMCRIAVHVAEGTGQIIVLSAIDNLVKGAAGQGVQCMNIAFGLNEMQGLQTPALQP
ncbi:MAG: N-acetyl-gamma-glutamyl-phosphate reductase [Pseudomonadota bacterium]